MHLELEKKYMNTEFEEPRERRVLKACSQKD